MAPKSLLVSVASEECCNSVLLWSSWSDSWTTTLNSTFHVAELVFYVTVQMNIMILWLAAQSCTLDFYTSQSINQHSSVKEIRDVAGSLQLGGVQKDITVH